MLALYLDEDTQRGELADALRRRGFDCLTVNQAGNRGRPDPDQLRIATELGRTLVSRNVGDFQQLHYQWLASGKAHAGIIVISPQRASIGVQVECIERIDARWGQSGMVDRLEFLLNYR